MTRRRRPTSSPSATSGWWCIRAATLVRFACAIRMARKRKGSSASRGFRSRRSTASPAGSSRTTSPAKRRSSTRTATWTSTRPKASSSSRLDGQPGPAAAVHDASETLLLRVPGRVERSRNLRGRAFSLRGSRRRRHDGAGFQPGLQPALRLQSVHDLSHSARGESSAREDPRGRKGVSRQSAAAGRRALIAACVPITAAHPHRRGQPANRHDAARRVHGRVHEHRRLRVARGVDIATAPGSARVPHEAAGRSARDWTAPQT